MREELQRLFAGPVLIGGARERFHERATVAEHGQFPLVEEVLHFRHVRVKPVRPAAHRRYRQQAGFGYRETGAGAYVCVALDETACWSIVLIERYEHVVAIVAAIQKDANQRAIITGGLRR